jgi:hypothetical protein
MMVPKESLGMDMVELRSCVEHIQIETVIVIRFTISGILEIETAAASCQVSSHQRGDSDVRLSLQ